MRYLTWILFFFILPFSAFSQSTEIVIKVQDTVTVGTPFAFEIELNNIQSNFRNPEFQGLRLVGGPNTSSSFSIINGVSSSKTVYKYFLLAEAEGDYTIFLHEIDAADGNIVFDEINIHAMNGKTNDSTLIKYYESSSSPEIKKSTSKRKIRKI